MLSFWMYVIVGIVAGSGGTLILWYFMIYRQKINKSLMNEEEIDMEGKKPLGRPRLDASQSPYQVKVAENKSKLEDEARKKAELQRQIEELEKVAIQSSQQIAGNNDEETQEDGWVKGEVVQITAVSDGVYQVVINVTPKDKLSTGDCWFMQ